MKNSQINFVRKQFVADVKRYIKEVDLLEQDIQWIVFRGVVAPYSVIRAILSNEDDKCTEDVFNQLKNNYPFNNEEFTFSVTVKGDIAYKREKTKNGKVVWTAKKLPSQTLDIDTGEESHEKGTEWNIIKIKNHS
ncbi:hypothetical protein [Priestia megaterium]|uniref:hypothetical protein n=1 Tax=Priestia megaterium TaxID=1404 RepID=UPI003CC55AEF